MQNKTSSKNINSNTKKLRFKRIVTVLFILFFSYAALLWVYATAKDSRVRENVTWREEFVYQYNETFAKILTDIFDEASICAQKGEIPYRAEDYVDHCDGLIRSRIDEYNSKLGATAYGTRFPLYFIRLQDNTIEKLYQSGTYFQTPIKTYNDIKVKKVLQGSRNHQSYPLYTCIGQDGSVGGDDINCDFAWLILPDKRPLSDFPSELELIFPIKDDQGKLLGAVVFLYGD